MLITGVWAIFTGRLPARLFRVLFGKGEYIVKSQKARLIGLLLASPIPLTFLTAFLLGITVGPQAVQNAPLIETLIVIIVCIIAVIVARGIKNQPIRKDAFNGDSQGFDEIG